MRKPPKKPDHLRLIHPTPEFEKGVGKSAAEKYQECLDNPVLPGNGCHQWLLKVANYACFAGLPEQQCFDDLRKLLVNTSRPVTDQEIWDAIEKAYSEGGADVKIVKTEPLVKDGRSTLERIIAEGKYSAFEELRKNSPIPIPENAREQQKLFFRTLFNPEDLVFCGDSFSSGPTYVRPTSFWIEHGSEGPFVIINPLTGRPAPKKSGTGQTYRGDNCVAAYKYCLVEFDGIGLEEQIRFWSSVPLPVRALVYTGGKSIHGWVDLGDLNIKDASDWQQKIKISLYKELLEPLGVDSACSNAARLARLPGCFRREKQKTQELLWIAEKGREVEQGERLWDALKTMCGITPEAEEEAKQKLDGRPIIYIRPGDLHEMVSQAEQALIQAGTPFYARGGRLQRPVTAEVDATDGRKTTVATLALVEEPAMIDALSKAALWMKGGKNKPGPTMPPSIVAKILLGRVGEWRFPEIVGIITTPTLRPDGTILSTPGYDQATRLLLESPPQMQPIPEKPSFDDARRALKKLLALLEEMPFADEASRSVALSALITPVARGAFLAVPHHAVTAPKAGTGKSYLVDTAAAIALGQRCPVIGETKSEEELEKRLATAVMEGLPLVSLDNVNATISSGFLCQLIERPLVNIRVLGHSRSVTVENRTTFFSTGNNLIISGDLPRRTIRCRLDAGMENPEQREFKKNPFMEVLKARGDYIAAALTIPRAYIAAGLPGKLPSLPSFERWSDYVRSALVWLGCVDPVETMASIRDEDPRRDEIQAVVTAWAEMCPNQSVTAADLIDRTRPLGSGEEAQKAAVLRDALSQVCERRGELDTRALGYWLRRHKDMVVGDWRIVAGEHTRKGVAWRLVAV